MNRRVYEDENDAEDDYFSRRERSLSKMYSYQDEEEIPEDFSDYELEKEEEEDFSGISYVVCVELALRERKIFLLSRFLENAQFSMEDPNLTLEEFLYFLEVSFEENWPEGLDIIKARYDEFYDVKTPIHSFIFSTGTTRVDLLKFLAESCKISFSDCVTGMFYHPKEEMIIRGFDNIKMTYPPQERTVYLELGVSLLESDCPLLEVFETQIDLLLLATNTKAELPTYIIEQNPLRTHQELVDSLANLPDNVIPSTEENVAKMVVETMLAEGVITRADIPKQMRIELEKLATMTENERSEVLYNHSRLQLEIKTKSNDEYFRVLGPCFSGYRPLILDKNSPNPCCRNGGCRMFTCVEYEDEDDEENLRFTHPELIEWFTNSCDSCQNTEFKKHEAVRMPIGGWKGCYCSWECVKNDLKGSVYSTNLDLCDIFSNAMKMIGIYDRTWPDVEEVHTKEELLEITKSFMDYMKELHKK